MESILSILDLQNVIDIIKGIFQKMFDAILSLLPNSPFQYMLQNMTALPYLPVLNWFVPVAEIVYVTSLWLVAIGIYYVYSAILRFVRAIK